MRPSNTMVFFENVPCKFHSKCKLDIFLFAYIILNPLFCANDLLTVHFSTYYKATLKINELKGHQYQLKLFYIYSNTLPFKGLGSV